MFDTNQPSLSTITPRRVLSRRRLLVGLAGSGALLLLGSPAIYATAQSIQRQLTTRRLDLSDEDIPAAWSNDLEYVAIHTPGQKRLGIWDYEQERINRAFHIDQSNDARLFVWSPDNQRLMAITQHETEDARLICWHVQTQQQLYTVRGDFYLSLGTPSWSPDAKKLAVFYSSKLFMLDASNGHTLYTQEFSDKKSARSTTIKALAWSPDSKNVALLVRQSETNEHSVLIWDVVNRQQTARLGTQIQESDNHQDTPLAWSPTGDYLATILNTKLELLHVSDSSKNVTFSEAFKEDYHLLAWSPGGQYLAATDSGQTSIWDSSKKEQVRVLYRGQIAFRIEKLAWPRDGQEVALVNASHDLVHYTW